MPQLDPTSYASQIFWLLICFFSLLFIMSKFIIPKIADIRQQRESKIDGYLHKAEQLQQKTEAAIAKYQTALDNATAEANKALLSAKDDLNKTIAQKQADLDKKLQAQVKVGEAEINASKEQALKQIKTMSVGLAEEILQKFDIANIKSSDIKTIIDREAE